MRAVVAQSVERRLGKAEVGGSIPLNSLRKEAGKILTYSESSRLCFLFSVMHYLWFWGSSWEALRSSYNPFQEGADTEVCTRFPPEPNGYLHIGHAKSILLNSGLAKKYHGTFHLRFDDTNPTKEDTEYVESIKTDVEWLGADFKDHLYFASDYFDQMYECAVKLIKKGKAYVCDLSADEIREYRGTLTEPGKNSPYRDRSIEENLKLFEEMKNGA